ncbi:hypothetical protein FRB90_000555 [Tulasnella sp. 427]|nr:hypothetical protein FRB90_000555 [Tulasnella sp. 427]
MRHSILSLAIVAASSLLINASMTWKQVRVGGGQGFVPGIVFCPKTKGVAYARTDIGGLYKLNSDDSWTPLTDWVGTNNWHDWGVDALAVDPTDCNKVYIAVGMYSISWDPNVGSILRSTDGGSTWSETKLTFKVGGNMPGRGIGERLSVDPNSPNIIYFGARSGNGLWKSTDSGATWSKVSAFPSTGTYVQDASSEYTADPVGLASITVDASSSSSGQATKRIFVGVANVGTSSVFVSNDAGATWSAVSGQPTTNNLPHKGVISPSEGLLYISFNNNAGPYDGTLSTVQKYNISSGVWTDITPKPSDYNGSDQYYGWGGLAVDLQKPGTIMVANLNSWWPDGNIFRSTDSGKTWSPLWAWASYPNINRYYKYDVSLAPWIGVVQSGDTKQIGQMIESLDSVHNVTLKSLAQGIEESAVQALISPPTGHILSPACGVTSLVWAGVPTTILRIGNDGSNLNGKQVAISTNSGSTWSVDSGAWDYAVAGKGAISAQGDVVLWATSANGTLVSRYTNNFSLVSSLPTSGVQIASDKVNNAVFYAAAGNKFYLSKDFAVTFSASSATLGSSTTTKGITVNVKTTGDVWVSTDAGLFHTVNNGTSFTQITGFTVAYSVSTGASKTTGGYPSVYVFGTHNTNSGLWRSDDQGSTWTRLDDASHGFGSQEANTSTTSTSATTTKSSSMTTSSSTTKTTSSSTTTTTKSSSTTTSSSIKTTTTTTTTTKTSSSTTTTKSSTTTTTATATGTGACHYCQCGGIGYTYVFN